MYTVHMSIALFIDVRHEGVSGALALVDPKLQKTFVGWATHISDHTLEKFDEYDALLTKVIQEGMPAMAKALPKDHIKKISEIHIMMGAPDVLSQTKTVHITHDTPFTIKSEHLKKIALETGDAFKENHKGEILEQIEEDITHVAINGYPTKKPVGKNANNFQAILFQSFISTDVVKKITDRTHKLISSATIQFHSFAFTTFKTIAKLDPNASNFVVVNLSEQATEVLVCREGSILQTGFSASGKQELIAHIATFAKTTSEAAESLLQLYSQNALEERVTSTVEEAIKSARTNWLTSFSTLIYTLSEGFSVPSRFFIIKEPLSALLSTWIQTEEFTQLTLSQAQYAPEEISLATFQDNITIKEGNNVPDNLFTRLLIEIEGIKK